MSTPLFAENICIVGDFTSFVIIIATVCIIIFFSFTESETRILYSCLHRCIKFTQHTTTMQVESNPEVTRKWLISTVLSTQTLRVCEQIYPYVMF